MNILLHQKHDKECNQQNSFKNNKYYDHGTGECKSCPEGSQLKASGGSRQGHLNECMCDGGIDWATGDAMNELIATETNVGGHPVTTWTCEPTSTAEERDQAMAKHMGNLLNVHVQYQAKLAQEEADKRAKEEQLRQAKKKYEYYTNYEKIDDNFDSLKRLVDENKDDHLSTIVMFQDINRQINDLHVKKIWDEAAIELHVDPKERQNALKELNKTNKQLTAMTTDLKKKCREGGYKLEFRRTTHGISGISDKKTEVCLAIGYLSHHTTEKTCTDDNNTWIASEQKCLKM